VTPKDRASAFDASRGRVTASDWDIFQVTNKNSGFGSLKKRDDCLNERQLTADSSVPTNGDVTCNQAKTPSPLDTSSVVSGELNHSSVDNHPTPSHVVTTPRCVLRSHRRRGCGHHCTAAGLAWIGLPGFPFGWTHNSDDNHRFW